MNLHKITILAIALGMAFTAVGQTSTKNYVQTTTARQALTGEISGNNNSSQVMKSVGYFDGLGRPIQSVTRWGTPGAKDIIAVTEYDEFGRQDKAYLPASTTSTNGAFHTGGVTETETLYDNLFGGNNGDYAFSSSQYDNSPLSRVIAQKGPGEAWANKHVETEFGTNVEDEVIHWKVNDDGFPYNETGDDQFYTEGKLSKVITTDENGSQVIQFTDLSGNVILKKVESGVTSEPWYLTYYVYDDFNRLRYVIPPRYFEVYGETPQIAEDQYTTGIDYYETNKTLTSTPAKSVWVQKGSYIKMSPGFTFSAATEGRSFNAVIGTPVLDTEILSGLAFQYHYDERGRMVAKKVPGADWVFMVYDQWDRLVLTQDGNQRGSDQWSFTKYDVLNRPVMAGFTTDSRNYKDIQSSLEGALNRYETFTNTGSYKYSNNVFPTSMDDVLIVTFYDDYAFTSTTFAEPAGVFTVTGNLEDVDAVSEVKGQVTGSWTKYEGAFLETVSFYDDKYRVTQVVADIQEGGQDVVTTQYDFVGNARNVHQSHSFPNASADYTVIMRYEYDHMNRLTETYHKFDNSEEVLLSENVYNELGELEEKGLLSRNSGSSFSQVNNFNYNIRGWLKSINGETGSLNSDFDDYFDMDLYYEDTYNGNSESQYNGNISAMRWTNPLNGSQVFNYTYDKANRIKTADYGANNNLDNNFDLKAITYDANGNIKTLQRRGKTGTSSFGLMDNLTYTYDNNNKGNRLMEVTDAGNDNYGFKDGNTSGDDYSYDANGNMIVDKNKGIANIVYNHLDLPVQVTMSGNKTISYLYDAAGVKHAKIVNDNGDITRTDYAGAFHYEDDKLQFVNHEEGRLLDGYNYQLHLKDHLGNVRATVQPERSTYLATMESENSIEETVFEQVSETRHPDGLYNHTPGGNESARLNASINQVVGPGKSLAVDAGDTVYVEVYAKYPSYANDPNSIVGVAGFVAGAFGLSPAGETSAAYSSLNSTLGSGTSSLFNFSADPDLPRAYLNYLYFDENHVFQYGGFQQVSDDAKNNFEKLSLEFVPDEPGYVYIYVANETDANLNVFFDDLKITHAENPIVQVDDYYPFGLTFNSYSDRPLNKYKFNSKEEQDWGVFDFEWRSFDPSIGRFTNIDPHSERYFSDSPYNYVFNNPVLLVDPNGMDGTIYYQVLLSGNDELDRNTKAAVNEAVEMINQAMSDLGIKLKAEAHFGTEEDIMSKDEFFSRDGAHFSDTYLVVGNTNQIQDFSNNTENLGWGPLGHSLDDKVGKMAGFKVDHGYDPVGVLNTDNIINQDGSVINGESKDGSQVENYRSAAEKFSIIAQHESGHPKFRWHKGNQNTEGSSTGHGTPGHVPGTIMDKLPKRDSKYDNYMLKILELFHNPRIIGCEQ